MACKLSGVRYAMLSIGTGPVRSPISRWLIRRAVSAADYVSVREPNAARDLHAMGVRRRLPLVPDMAFGLSDASVPLRAPSDVVTVGLNVMAHTDRRYWPSGDDSRYQAYIAKMAEFATTVIESGHTARLFSSHLTADCGATDDVERLVHTSFPSGVAPHLIREPMEGLDDLLRAINDCDVVVTARFHSILVPLNLERPTIGLAYHGTTNDLMAQLGQSAFRMDIDRFTAGDMLGSSASPAPG